MKNSEIYIKHQELTEKIYEGENMLPSRYVLVLTNLCNLNCSFCYQEKKYIPNNMTTQNWLDLVRQFPSYSRVTLTGGEPFMFKGFKEIFHKVASSYDCNIISNGLLLSESLIDFLLSYKNFKTLSISVDTISNINRDVKAEDWARVLKMMKYFLKKRDEIHPECKLDIKTTVVDDNIYDLNKIHRYCIEDLKADFHSFQLLKGSPLQHSDKHFDYNDIFINSKAHIYKDFEILKNQLNKVREYNINKKVSGFIHPKVCDLMDNDTTNIDFINNELHNPDIYESCKFPWSSVHINCDGSLIPCLAISMGNLKVQSLKEVIESDMMKKFKTDIKKFGTVPACNRCGWLKPTKDSLVFNS